MHPETEIRNVTQRNIMQCNVARDISQPTPFPTSLILLLLLFVPRFFALFLISINHASSPYFANLPGSSFPAFRSRIICMHARMQACKGGVRNAKQRYEGAFSFCRR